MPSTLPVVGTQAYDQPGNWLDFARSSEVNDLCTPYNAEVIFTSALLMLWP